MTYQAVSPLGERVLHAAVAMDAVSTHEDGTIGFVWDQLFYGDRMFELWKPELGAVWPGVTFAGPDEFGNIHDAAFDEETGVELLKASLRQRGVTGVVVGVGA